MGLSSLRRHRGGYVDANVARSEREPTREELSAMLETERAKTAAAEAQSAALQSELSAMLETERAKTETPAESAPQEAAADAGRHTRKR